MPKHAAPVTDAIRADDPDTEKQVGYLLESLCDAAAQFDRNNDTEQERYTKFHGWSERCVNGEDYSTMALSMLALLAGVGDQDANAYVQPFVEAAARKILEDNGFFPGQDV